MTTFPGSPRITKGALVSIDLFNPLAGIVIFQYNPENLTRTLTPQVTESSDRFKGPPEEKISASIEINAVDQLERADSTATRLGIYPQLAALEMMIYPKSLAVIANAALSLVGTIEVVPPKAPLTVFIWGIKRVVPVSLTSLSIEEQAFDVNLNPIRAKVSLGLQVLTYNDLPRWSIGNGLFMAHQVAKEVMATLSSAGSLTRISETQRLNPVGQAQAVGQGFRSTGETIGSAGESAYNAARDLF